MLEIAALLGLAAVGTAVVQGAIIAAVGLSTPELASFLLAMLLHQEFKLGIGAVVGSAVFNLLVIPGLSVLVGGRAPTNRDLVYKEALFYMLAVAALLLTFSLAVIYRPQTGDFVRGTVTRPLALFPLWLYGLYLFTQYLDAAEDNFERDPDVDAGRSWLWFAVGLGEAFGTPSFLWGLVVVAAGSSVPDAFVSVTAAREGCPAISLANVLGSNVFGLLVAVPLGVLLAGGLVITFEYVVPMMGFLVLATTVFFAIVRTEMALSRREATLLLALYGLFVAWLVLESVGATTVLPQAGRPGPPGENRPREADPSLHCHAGS